MPDRSSGSPDRSMRAPPSRARMAAIASSTQGGGGAAARSGNRRFSRACAAGSFGSGNCSPTRPAGRQAMPHGPIGVSNKAKPESLISAFLTHRGLHSYVPRASDCRFDIIASRLGTSGCGLATTGLSTCSAGGKNGVRMADSAQFDTHVADQKFQLLVNAVTDYALYMLEPDGRVATWNPGACRFKGYEADEIIGQHFSRFFTDEDREAGLPSRALRTASEEGKYESEGWRVRKDGTRFWASVVIDPVWDRDGALIGFAKITRDISEKKEAERALFASEQKLRLLVQGIRDCAIYMLDPEGRISNWNVGAEAIKGYRADEAVGKHFSMFYTEEDRAVGMPSRALATAREAGKYENEAWRVRKDGSRFWASVLIDSIHDDDGNFIGFAKVTRDITERRQAQV